MKHTPNVLRDRIHRLRACALDGGRFEDASSELVKVVNIDPTLRAIHVRAVKEGWSTHRAHVSMILAMASDKYALELERMEKG